MHVIVRKGDTVKLLLLFCRFCSQQNIIVCEGQKAYVSCSSIFDEITVMETMYGRKNPSICVHPSIPSSTVCQEQETQINAQIKGLCEGEHTCEVAANNEFMAKAGTTICPNVYKYLEIKYRSVSVSMKYLHIKILAIDYFLMWENVMLHSSEGSRGLWVTHF